MSTKNQVKENENKNVNEKDPDECLVVNLNQIIQQIDIKCKETFGQF